MSDNIENFIEDNRAKFDDDVPSGKVWENIESAFKVKKKVRPVQMPLFKWNMAAAAILIIGCIIYFQINKKNVEDDKTVKTETDINTLAPEHAPEMNEFAKLINMKQEELKTLSKEQPQLYQKFTTDITQLDSSYKSLKNQLSSSPNTELLIEAMIQNLQLQLNVLNQQLNIINEIKQSKKYSHEKNYEKI